MWCTHLHTRTAAFDGRVVHGEADLPVGVEQEVHPPLRLVGEAQEVQRVRVCAAAYLVDHAKFARRKAKRAVLCLLLKSE